MVDTSAVVAILFDEDGSADLISALSTSDARLISAATLVELGIVVEARLGPAGIDVVSRFMRDSAVDIVAVDGDTAERALSCWRRFGKGHHRVALNYGDCFSYALAEVTGFPLLCTGNDFAATDLDIFR